MAKSPTPIPAPPVKIHRGAPGSAPARQRRRRKKVNPFVLFLRGLARRLYFGIKTAFKFLLFVPVLVFMVAFSYNVDRSGLFQGALAPRRIVDLMLQGYDVTNFEQMDEREVVQLFAQDVPETPEAIGIGSSRVLQFNRENTGVESFFNMGVTGADVRDNMTSYYKMVTYGKAPKVLLWSIDPWVFYGSEAAFDARADADLYNEFLTKVLNVPTDYEEPDKVELWKALADGEIQTVSTDHCSFTLAQKDAGRGDFTKIPGGMPGVETRGTLLFTYGVAAGRITAERMADVLAETPAKLYGLFPRKGVIAAGSDADIVVYDPGASHVLRGAELLSKAGYTPFEGFRTNGGIAKVYLRGSLQVDGGKVIGGKMGEYLKRGKCAL